MTFTLTRRMIYEKYGQQVQSTSSRVCWDYHSGPKISNTFLRNRHMYRFGFVGWVTTRVLAGENLEGDRKRSWHPDWHWWTDTKPHFWALCKNFSWHRSFKESIWWNSCWERRIFFQSGGPIWAETVILP